MWFRSYNPSKISLLFFNYFLRQIKPFIFCNYLSFSFSANLILLFSLSNLNSVYLCLKRKSLTCKVILLFFFCLTFNANLVPILSRWITFKGLKLILLGVKNNRETDLNLESILPNFFPFVKRAFFKPGRFLVIALFYYITKWESLASKIGKQRKTKFGNKIILSNLLHLLKIKSP